MREAAFRCGAPAGVAGPCLRAPHTISPREPVLCSHCSVPPYSQQVRISPWILGSMTSQCQVGERKGDCVGLSCRFKPEPQASL